MKNVCYVLLLLSILMMLMTTGCNRIGDASESSVSSITDTSEGSQWTCDSLYASDYQWKVTGLYGATDNELKEYFSDTVYCNDMMLEMYAATPTSLSLRTRSKLTHLVYDFASGTFTSACKDPVCNHENCIWKVPRGFFYNLNNAMYVVRSDEKAIYKADFNGENITEVYKGTETPYDLKYIDGILYFQDCTIDTENNETVYTLYAISDEENVKPLFHSRGESNALSYLPVGDGSILYSTALESEVKLYNGNDQSTALIGSGILLCAYESGKIYYETDDGFFVSSNKDLSDGIKLFQRWADVKFIYDGQVYFADTVDGVAGLYAIAAGEEKPKLVYAWEKEGETCCRIGNLLLIQRSSEGPERYNCFEMVDLATGATFNFTNKR